MNILNKIYNLKNHNSPSYQLKKLKERHKRYCFTDLKCNSKEQYRASITRLYHTIEKGLAYENYRAGFGADNVNKLIETLSQFSRKYNIDEFCYRTALDCLYKYIAKNKEYGLQDDCLNERIACLPGTPNSLGGVIEYGVNTLARSDENTYDYEQFVKSRHSIRHFNSTPVKIDDLKEAINLARYTPSACNRQGWRTRIIVDRDIIRGILENQNGNRGFGQEIDKLLVITADLRCFQINRELFQPFIDGGMYAQSVLNALHYKEIGSVPLSAALLTSQEKIVRNLISMNEAEVLIMFIGVGTLPDESYTTRSERYNHDIEII